MGTVLPPARLPRPEADERRGWRSAELQAYQPERTNRTERLRQPDLGGEADPSTRTERIRRPEGHQRPDRLDRPDRSGEADRGGQPVRGIRQASRPTGTGLRSSIKADRRLRSAGPPVPTPVGRDDEPAAADRGSVRSVLRPTAGSGPSRAANALVGKRKKPGGRRRPSSARAFPVIPAVASAATLVAAASGAVTLHSVAASGIDGNVLNPPSGVALSLGQLQDARSAAAGRADRSRGGPASVDPGIDDSAAGRAAKLRQESNRERAAWEAQRTRELELIVDKASDATSEQVFERTIEWFLPVQGFRLSAGFGQAGGMWS
ncbi:MAG: hypothetical protein ACRDP8_10570, partial [Actinopolymorphaceae bacterium]